MGFEMRRRKEHSHTHTHTFLLTREHNGNDPSLIVTNLKRIEDNSDNRSWVSTELINFEYDVDVYTHSPTISFFSSSHLLSGF